MIPAASRLASDIVSITMADRTSSSYTIEAMSIDDFDEATRLWKKTEGVGLNESDSRPALSLFLARNPGLSLVTRHSGKVVATVLCGHDGRRGFLYHLAVAESHRKNGLGKELVEMCLEKLGRLGILRCNILVFNHNTEGEAFWLRQGWTKRSELQLLQKMLTSSPGCAC